ncbi:MAG: glycosyltransferase [Puniceicoccaceae bacterium]|nr:MAG: glycosyltransferase [Puniceicoccaceae bacterium]
MKSTGHRVEVRFGGEGESYITPLAKRLNVEDYVKFTGWHSNPNEFIDQLDLLVLPSVKESFGLVIIEAMAREKPVLATRCHGPSSIIVDGKTGYLIPISDEAALAKKMIEAMEDSDLTAKGKAGFIRVLSHYTPSNAGTKLIEALTELGVHFENERTK